MSFTIRCCVWYGRSGALSVVQPDSLPSCALRLRSPSSALREFYRKAPNLAWGGSVSTETTIFE